MSIQDFNFDDFVEKKSIPSTDESNVEKNKEIIEEEISKEAEEALKNFETKSPHNEEEKKEEKKEEKSENLDPLGVKLLEDGWIEDKEELKEVEDPLEYVINKRIADLLDDLPPEVKQLNKYVLDGGDLNSYLESVKKEQKITQLPTDIDTPENQKLIIEAHYLEEGYDKDFIEEQIKYLEETGKLSMFANKFHSKVLEKVEMEKRMKLKEIEQRKKIEKEELRKVKDSVTNLIKEKKEINGITFSKSDEQYLAKYMYDKRIKAGKGQYISQMHKDLIEIMQDTEKSVVLAKLLKQKLSLKDLIKKAETQVASAVEDNLTRKNKKPSKGSLADFFLS